MMSVTLKIYGYMWTKARVKTKMKIVGTGNTVIDDTFLTKLLQLCYLVLNLK